MGIKMIVGVQGTSSFSDYNVFLRAMAVAMSNMPADDSQISIYTAGPMKINSMASEFVNLSERGLKLRGKKVKLYKVPPSWIEENIQSFNYFAFLSQPKERVSSLVEVAENNNIEVGIFRY
jgi:hypothetical protein